MDKTRIDDILIKMITPKIKEIESKFSNNQALDQKDINTLLLKAQYNHINHLDDKLNEVTNSVLSLEGKFVELGNNLDKRFIELDNKFDKRFIELDNKFDKRFIDFDNKLELLDKKIEHTIQKALNKNMFALISVMGAFLVLSKIIDKF